MLVVGCESPTTTQITEISDVNSIQDIHQSLSITPQPNNQLCWYNENTFVDNWDEFINTRIFNDGLAFGLVIKSGKQIGNHTYQITPNTPTSLTYRGYYHSATDTSATLPVRYIVLLDEQQLTNPFNNVDTPYLDMIFDYHQTETFDMTIPPLEEGIHELIVIGVEQADIMNDGRAGVFAIRVTLVVGNPPLMVDRTQYEFVQPTEYRNRSNADTYWSLSLHSDQSHLIWDYPNVYKSVADTLNFYMRVGYMENAIRQAERNITPQPQPIALIALLDYVQVPIQEDKWVYYGMLSPDNSFTYIPANINVSDYNGEIELLVIQISYPRIPYCLLVPPPVLGQAGYYFFFAIEVQRHGVDVQN
ncbi:MAG: hypothetical protein CUN52_04685 [Phototrophicales bacterium]|jgi:hypothetical protein|nr:MAG: hypothetical protein CUN52_04685 [Phototrophicales bacterium]